MNKSKRNTNTKKMANTKRVLLIEDVKLTQKKIKNLILDIGLYEVVAPSSIAELNSIVIDNPTFDCVITDERLDPPYLKTNDTLGSKVIESGTDIVDYFLSSNKVVTKPSYITLYSQNELKKEVLENKLSLNAYKINIFDKADIGLEYEENISMVKNMLNHNNQNSNDDDKNMASYSQSSSKETTTKAYINNIYSNVFQYDIVVNQFLTIKSQNDKVTDAGYKFFGKKIINLLDEIRELSLNPSFDNDENPSIIKDSLWMGGNFTWHIEYPEENNSVSQKENNSSLVKSNDSNYELIYDREEKISYIKLFLSQKTLNWKLDINCINNLLDNDLEYLNKNKNKKDQILLNLLSAYVCASNYTLDNEKEKVFEIGRRLESEWKLETLKYIVQILVSRRKNKDEIIKSIEEWKVNTNSPKIIDILKGKIIGINIDNKSVKVELRSLISPEWNENQNWKLSLFDSVGLLKVNSYFLYTAFKISNTSNAYDIEIKDYI